MEGLPGWGSGRLLPLQPLERPQSQPPSWAHRPFPAHTRQVWTCDTFSFTILRDPARGLESAFYKTASPFALWPGACDTSWPTPAPSTTPGGPTATLAATSWPPTWAWTTTRRRLVGVQAVAPRFHLVPIAQHLGESLGPLRRAVLGPG